MKRLSTTLALLALSTSTLAGQPDTTDTSTSWSHTIRPFIQVGYLGSDTIQSEAGQSSTSSVVVSSVQSVDFSRTNIGLGAAIGENYHYKRWDFGGELAYAYHHSMSQNFSGFIVPPAGVTMTSNYLLALTTQTVLANFSAGYQYNKWQPFALFGLGVGLIKADNTITETISGVTTTSKASHGINKFTWQIGAGARIPLTTRTALQLSLSYLDYGRVKLGTVGENFPFYTGTQYSVNHLYQIIGEAGINITI